MRGEFGRPHDRCGAAVAQGRRTWPTGRVPATYVFDLGGAFPVDRIALDLPELNSVAPAQVYSRAGPEGRGEPWARPSSIDWSKQDGDETTSPPLPVATLPARYWRFRVDPRSGGLGSKPPPLTALWMPQEIVFAARGDAPFALAYGSAQAQAGRAADRDAGPRLRRARDAGDVRRRHGRASDDAAGDGRAEAADRRQALGAVGGARASRRWCSGGWRVRLSRQMRQPATAATSAADSDGASPRRRENRRDDPRTSRRPAGRSALRRVDVQARSVRAQVRHVSILPSGNSCRSRPSGADIGNLLINGAFHDQQNAALSSRRPFSPTRKAGRRPRRATPYCARIRGATTPVVVTALRHRRR